MKIPWKIRALLWYLNLEKRTNIYDLPPEKARQSVSKISDLAERFIEYAPVALDHIFDQEITGRNGAIPIRIYQATNKKKPPLIIYFHGGGFVLNDLDSHDKICRRIARDNQAVVVAVDYRLAPEHKFPAAVYDAYDAVVWAAQNEAIHGGDPKKLIVMGDSAGGNLATVACMLARDLNGPDILHQVLIYPCTDGTLSLPTISDYGEGYLLTKKIMDWFIEHYKSSEKDIHNPLMSPLFAEHLSNLPSAFIITAEYDPLKDDGRLYAEKLKAAGNEIVYKDYGGLIHGFIGMPKLSKRILKTYDDIRLNLQAVLNKKNAKV